MPDTTLTLFTVTTGPDDGCTSCQGQFSVDEKRGYAGHLFLENYSPSSRGISLLELPPFLTRSFLIVITEDGHYTTLCYPRFGKRDWKNLSSLRVEFTFPYLVNKVGLDSEEESIKKIKIFSPTIASIVGIRPVTQTIDMKSAEGSATFNISRTTWAAPNCVIEIGDNRQAGASADHTEAHFRSKVYIAMEWDTPIKPSDALHQLRALDDFLSVAAGSFVSLDSVWLDVILDDPQTPKAEFQLSGYDTASHKAAFVEPYETLAHIPFTTDWSSLITKFIQNREENEIAFKWFRSSQVNIRYIEEVFLYTIRMVERYFSFSSDPDHSVNRILNIFYHRANDDAAITAFVDRRLRPLLTRRPSLQEKLRRLYTSFPEIKAFSEIPPGRVNYLRGKEAHGSETNYSTAEYVDMEYLSRSFLLAFRVAALEQSGLSRADVLQRAKDKSSKIRHLLV